MRQTCLGIFGATPAPVAMLTLHVDSRPWGVTVSSVIPVTMDPPKLLVSLFHDSVAAQHILRTKIFGISFLTRGHTLVARAQARPKVPKFLDSKDQHAEPPARLGDEAPQGPVGSTPPPPRLARAAHMDCRVVDHLIVDDHILLIGAVTTGHRPASTLDPLLYVGGAFARPDPLEPTWQQVDEANLEGVSE